MNQQYRNQFRPSFGMSPLYLAGRDMMSNYKETAMGGLAVILGLPVTVTEC